MQNYTAIEFIREHCSSCEPDTTLPNSPAKPVVNKEVRKYEDGRLEIVCPVCEFKTKTIPFLDTRELLSTL